MSSTPESLDELRVRIAHLEAERSSREQGLPPTMAQTPRHQDGPVITQAPATAYAWCSNTECPGAPNDAQPPQEQVAAIRETQAWTYAACGGDGMYADFTQNSIDSLNFADEAVANCVHCSARRQISEQKRPNYPRKSNQDPMGLLKLLRSGLVRPVGSDAEGTVVPGAKALSTDSKEF